MVAYTDPDCIPYFEGPDDVCLNTGTACDPSTVWCDQAEAIETKLDLFDSVVARVSTSVPLAWVETTDQIEYIIGTSGELHVEFTTVNVDTDNMVNLDVESDGFLINTAGLYNFWGYIQGVTNSSLGAGNTMEGNFEIILSGIQPIYGLPTIGSFSISWEVAVNDIRIAANGSLVLPVTAGTQVRMNLGGSGIGGDRVVYNQVSMGATWVGDLP